MVQAYLPAGGWAGITGVYQLVYLQQLLKDLLFSIKKLRKRKSRAYMHLQRREALRAGVTEGSELSDACQGRNEDPQVEQRVLLIPGSPPQSIQLIFKQVLFQQRCGMHLRTSLCSRAFSLSRSTITTPHPLTGTEASRASATSLQCLSLRARSGLLITAGVMVGQGHRARGTEPGTGAWSPLTCSTERLVCPERLSFSCSEG
ncbi:rCG37539, isoform CRA_b [Rattus norvegicus]|uniref:RCG37539, isoform CRA_b n=1 Tax=Rattus norvegicus TaxID=10116 RepID=A6KIC2_RAT|nr:rCG37539, isoform CRA_b [Rattus norvegicus]